MTTTARTIEHRIAPIRTVDGSTVRGYAALFDSDSKELGYFRPFIEQIDPKAFDRSLAEGHDVRLHLNHKAWDLPLARTSSGTLRLRVDAKGLAFEASIPDTSQGRDVRELLRRRDIADMSFGFEVRADSWTKGDPKRGVPDRRRLLDVRLHEISIVNEGAYPGPSATMVEAASLLARRGSLLVRSGAMLERLSRWNQPRSSAT